MAAGLGFKDFTTGEVLTAADVNGYLMQGIWVFASAAARDAAVTSPQEGNFAFLKDTNTTTYYTGSAWTNLDTTGMVNPMTTTGDTIYSSSGSTPARLGIGTAGQVLTVNSGATAPEWKTPAAGGSSFVGCKLYKTSDQTINNATHTAIAYGAEYFDTDGYHDNSTNNSRITIPSGKGGKYLIVCKGLSLSDNATGVRAASIRLNNTTDIVANGASQPGQSVSTNTAYFSAIWELSAGDYIEHRVYQNSGTSLTFYGSGSDGQYSTEFSIQYLGA